MMLSFVCHGFREYIAAAERTKRGYDKIVTDLLPAYFFLQRAGNINKRKYKMRPHSFITTLQRHGCLPVRGARPKGSIFYWIERGLICAALLNVARQAIFRF